MPRRKGKNLTRRKTFRFTDEDIEMMTKLNIDSDMARDMIREGLEKIKRFKL